MAQSVLDHEARPIIPQNWQPGGFLSSVVHLGTLPALFTPFKQLKASVDWKHHIAGACGGLGSVAVGYPFDTVRARVMNLGPTNCPNQPTTMRDVFKWTWKVEGVRGFYRGIVFPCIGDCLVATVSCGVYGNMKNRFASMLPAVTKQQAEQRTRCFGPAVCFPTDEVVAETTSILQNTGCPGMDVVEYHSTHSIRSLRSNVVLPTELRVEDPTIGAPRTISSNPDIEPRTSLAPITLQHDVPLHLHPQRHLAYAAAGSCAGLATAVCECPFDMLKTQIQIQGQLQQRAQQSLKQISWSLGSALSLTVAQQRLSSGVQTVNGVSDCFTKVRSNGALFRGLTVVMVRNTLGFAVSYSTFEAMKDILSPRKPARLGTGVDPGSEERPTPSASTLMIAGGVSGLCYWTLVMPMDVVRVNLQGQPLPKGKRLYSGPCNCVKQLWKRNGPSVFLKGWVPTISRAIPANAVMFYLYSRVVDVL